ncbi:hypothetical protein Cgig2_000218 [Carnegiea gigantea]|uniref:FAR1 domain-containing protein n=1 Tax=Carnegiea gigantea TaxID=171969 RepID=A0A9Q1JQP2_9CARY|nr:hypothetical protein Cgig2_000218 [Carnegiea gigantea]
MFLTFNSGQGKEGVDPIGIVDETQCVQDIMDDIVSEEKQNEGISSNFIDKRLDDVDENDMKKLIFKTPVEYEVFYFTYAKAVGFGVRREAPRMNHHGIVTSLRFCCDREGVRSEKDKNREDKKRKARDETRCFYKAFTSMKYMKTTCQYIVKEFKKEHNNHLVPPQQATYHLHEDVNKLDDDTLVVTCFIAHMGFDRFEVPNNFIFCLLLYWLITENQATNEYIGRNCDCHRRLPYGITHLKIMLVMFAILTFGSFYLKIIDLCLRNSASGGPNSKIICALNCCQMYQMVSYPTFGPSILTLCGCKEDVKKKVHATTDKFAERGLRSLAVARHEVPEKNKDSLGGQWQFVGLLPLFDPPRHGSAETIKRALNLGVNVKMITENQLAIAKDTG